MNTVIADVVLVEDNPSDAELTLRALADVTPASRVLRLHDGVEALDHLVGEGAGPPPRLILLDIKLPRVGGLDVLAALRKEARTRRVPVVVLTSSSIEADVSAAYRLGANAYVQKPVDFSRFRDVVQTLGRFWLDANIPAPGRPVGEGVSS